MDDTGPLKLPPHSIEAERSVLGGLMLDDNAWDAVSERVSSQDFYRSDHRMIFRCMADLVERNQPLDIITISESLEAAGELENIEDLLLSLILRRVSRRQLISMLMQL